MTERIYYQDAYCKAFTAQVVACTPEKKGYAVLLDRTAFYPEGGGQPGDTGTLNGISVLDTRIMDGDIIHITEAPLAPGGVVNGALDWKRRFSMMQHHTGEHIVSGLVHKHHGLENVGFHMGKEAVTVDYSGPLSWEQLLEIQRLANEAVYENRPIRISHPGPEELAKLCYRSKLELTGDVRIVEAPGCDICACCGTHVRFTGEIGAIKLLWAQNYKGGVRAALLCGAKAMADYEEKNAALSEIARLFSVKPEQAAGAVSRQQEEMARLKIQCAKWQSRAFTGMADALAGEKNVFLFEEGFTPEELRRCCLALAEQVPLAAVFSKDGDNWKFAMGGKQRDVRELCKKLTGAFEGRGGGTAELVQGSLGQAGKTALRAWLEENI